ncbi:glycosyltransferase, partial [Klebsiella variicola]|uniref:glycosyltransferase n=1 Tax=Klebsiella variicola TaxID=244366 RepID=UPI002731249A
GLAPLEAMACGLPAVVTKNGGPSESLKDSNNEYGVLVDPTDVDDIKDGLLSLLGPERRDRLLEMRALGERRVLSRYT